MTGLKKNLSVVFCGDFAPCRRWADVEPKIELFGELLSVIRNSDLSFVNLESPAINNGKPILKDGPNLSIGQEWLKVLKDTGFDLLGLANNHMGDYGPYSIIECINNCQSIGLATVGAGKNISEAQKIFYLEKEGIRLSVIAVCEYEYGIADNNKAGTAPLDVIDNVLQIQEAKKNSDFVIMTIHGGNEFFPYPRPGLRKQCKFYIDQGCDAIICHHPHVSGVYETYKEKPIFYSLGNFIFDSERQIDGWNEGYVVVLCLNKDFHRIDFEILPYIQKFEDGGITLLKNNDKINFFNKISNLKQVLFDPIKYNELWNDFCKTKKEHYLITNYSPLVFKGATRISKILGISKLLIGNPKTLSKKLNYVRCESHREVLLHILSNMYYSCR